ncbi:MAG: BREX system P-loop protein BrxC, partial [Clostridiales bacterium]|nr:BREX system P-loop protein BrxC [Clostridiales bacterium]
LANDTTFLEEIESSLKIERYMRLNSALKSNSNIEAIKLVKAGEKNERRERANLLLRELIRTSDIYVNNEKLDIKEKNPEERINDALRSLVDIVYSKLGYIKKSITSTKEIVDILLNDNNQVTINSLNENPNKNAVDEVNRYIERQSIGNNSITVKSVINHFIKAPFGWSDLDIEGIIAYLFKNQNIKMEFGGENLSTNDKNVTNYITKRDNLEKTKIKTRVSVPDSHIKSAKNISNLVFNTTITKFDEDSVMIDFKETLKDNLNYIKQLLEQYRRFNYPGKKILERGQELIEEVLSYKEPVAFFKTVNSLKGDFEDYGDDVADVLSFFKQGNPQKKNFETAIDRIEHSKENMSYLDEEAKELIEQMKNIVNMESPYKNIHELPIIIDKYNDKLVELYEEEAKKVRPIIKSHQEEVLNYLRKFNFYDEFKSRYFDKFENLNEELNSVRRFSDVVAIPDKSDRIKNQCIKEIDMEYKNRMPDKVTESEEDDCDGGSAVLIQQKTILIAKSSIIPYQPVIKSREDIDILIKAIETKLEKELEEKGEFKLV